MQDTFLIYVLIFVLFFINIMILNLPQLSYLKFLIIIRKYIFTPFFNDRNNFVYFFKTSSKMFYWGLGIATFSNIIRIFSDSDILSLIAIIIVTPFTLYYFYYFLITKFKHISYFYKNSKNPKFTEDLIDTFNKHYVITRKTIDLLKEQLIKENDLLKLNWTLLRHLNIMLLNKYILKKSKILNMFEVNWNNFNIDLNKLTKYNYYFDIFWVMISLTLIINLIIMRFSTAIITGATLVPWF